MSKMKIFLFVMLSTLMFMKTSCANMNSGMQGGRVHFVGRIIDDPCMVETNGSILTSTCPSKLSKTGLAQTETDLNKATTLTTESYDVSQKRVDGNVGFLTVTYK